MLKLGEGIVPSVKLSNFFQNSKKSYPQYSPRIGENRIFKNMEQLKNILEKSYSGVHCIEENLYRVNYGTSYLLYKFGEFTGNLKPIKQRILILQESDVDDIVEEFSTKKKIQPEDLGLIKNEINIHARGIINEYIDIQRNTSKFAV